MSIHLCNQHQYIAYPFSCITIMSSKTYLSPPITLTVPILDIFTLVLAVKSNFTNQYLLILTLGLTNNIFIMYELLCAVVLMVQYIWIKEV